MRQAVADSAATISVAHASDPDRSLKIQGMIMGGELKAGEKVPSQRVFFETLKVSRASLREALLRLEAIGLL